MRYPKNIRIFPGNANPELANAICSHLNVSPASVSLDRFPDGEIRCKINDDVRGSDAFVIQPTCPPVNEAIMELVIMIDCLRRASAERITAVMPYFGYARQDRKDEGRVPITAKLIANMIHTAGADRVLTMDLHAAQIQGFFDLPVDHLYAAPVFYEHFLRMRLPNVVVLAPDVGSSKRAGYFSKHLNAPLAIVDKRRMSADETKVAAIIGSVKDHTVIIPDDMISTGGTLVGAVEAARAHGAKDIYICATHAVFSGPCVERLNALEVKEIAVTDSIPTHTKPVKRLKVLSIASMMAEAIRRIHLAESISIMFRNG